MHAGIEWMDECRDALDGCTDGLTDAWMKGYILKSLDGWMDERRDKYLSHFMMDEFEGCKLKWMDETFINRNSCKSL